MLTALLAALALQSSSFEANAAIPARYTCQGEDATPVLSVSDVPAAAKTLALVVDDPDAPDPAAPKRTWVHWVVYDLPARAGEISPGAGRAGKGDEGKTVWRGPCPPVGRHRYFFKLYALDAALGDRGALTKSELEKAMEGHVLEKTELVGTYEKSAK